MTSVSRATTEKHLHGRGEDLSQATVRSQCKETPPRAWRRPQNEVVEAVCRGNTSTDVEKTTNAVLMVHSFGETPPRTWRRPPLLRLGTRWRGNTSTDVEKTRWSFACTAWGKKHLHGRGEDGGTTRSHILSKETPPRTWRRPSLRPFRFMVSRNTSTDVEKT